MSCNKTTATASLTLGLAFLILIAALQSGDAASPIETIHYEDGIILEDYIPYAKAFAIVGPTKTAWGKADGIQLSVLHRGRTIYTRAWVRPPGDAAADSFRIVVRERLKIDRPYDFVFEFYERIQNVDPMPIVRAVTRRLDPNSLPPKEGTGQDATQRARSLIEAEMAEAADETIESAASGRRIVGLSPDDFEFKPDVPPFKVTNEVMGVILEAVDSVHAAQQVADDFETLNFDADEIRSSVNEFEVNDKMQAALDGPGAADLPYTSDDLDKLSDFANRDETMPPASLDNLRSFLDRRSEFADVLPDSGWAALDSTVAVSTRLGRLDERLTALTKKDGHIQRLRDRAGEVVRGFAIAQYIPRAQVALPDQFVWPGRTEVNKLKFGFSYAAGAAFLGLKKREAKEGEVPDGDTETDLFSSFLIRYHPFGQVDKSLPRKLAYSNSWAHISLDVGLALGDDLDYQGTKLTAAFLGMKPMLGLGFDFTPDFAIHIGGILFRQQSVHPLSSDESGTKLGLYLMGGYDFNLFNWIRENLPGGVIPKGNE